jgi:uncharacterized BrkB/YihY/UPF0761 family membrane protein
VAPRIGFDLLLDLFKETLTAWNADKAPRLAAAIAY